MLILDGHRSHIPEKLSQLRRCGLRENGVAEDGFAGESKGKGGIKERSLIST